MLSERVCVGVELRPEIIVVTCTPRLCIKRVRYAAFILKRCFASPARATRPCLTREFFLGGKLCLGTGCHLGLECPLLLLAKEGNSKNM